MQAVPTIRSIMGFENIVSKLNDPGGTKYACFCLGVRTRGTGSNTALGGFSGVPLIYGLASGVAVEFAMSMRIWD